MSKVGKAILFGVAISGTLDMVSAFVFSGIKGVGPDRVMATVASGPFGDTMRGNGINGIIVGTFVHYAIMTAMVTVLVLTARAWPVLRRQWLAAGIVYGLLLYVVMYWGVLPMRWPEIHPRTDLWTIGNALFSHIICVGIPMAWVTRRVLGTPAMRLRG